MSYTIIYNTIAFRTDDNLVMLLGLTGDNNCTELSFKGKERRVRNWYILKSIYNPNGKEVLIPINDALNNIEETIKNWVGNSSFEDSSDIALRTGSSFVTYKTLLTHLKNTINHAITIDEYKQLTRNASLSLALFDDTMHALFINNSDELKKLNCIDVDKYSIKWYLNENIKVKQREKSNIIEMERPYYLYSDAYVLCKRGTKYIRYSTQDTKNNTYGLSVEVLNHLTDNKTKVCMFKTKEEALNFAVNNFYNPIYDCWSIDFLKVGKLYRAIDTITVEEELQNYPNIYCDFFAIYSPTYNEYVGTFTGHKLKYSNYPLRMFGEKDAIKRFDHITSLNWKNKEYLQFVLVHFIGKEPYIVKYTDNAEDIVKSGKLKLVYRGK